MEKYLRDSENRTLRFDYKQGDLYHFTQLDTDVDGEDVAVSERTLTYRETLKLDGGKDLLADLEKGAETC